MAAHLSVVENTGPLNPQGRDPALLALASTSFPGMTQEEKIQTIRNFSFFMERGQTSAAQTFSWINDLFRDYSDIALFEFLPEQLPALYRRDSEKTFLLAKAIIEKMPQIINFYARQLPLSDLKILALQARMTASQTLAGFVRVAGEQEPEKICELMEVGREAYFLIGKIIKEQEFSREDEAPRLNNF